MLSVKSVKAADRERILRLAKLDLNLRKISDQVGEPLPRVKAVVHSAEKGGELPAGTLDKLLTRRPRRVEVVSAPETCQDTFRVYAPTRNIARRMGCCAACSESIEIVIKAGEIELGLCRAHAEQTQQVIPPALQEAWRIRTRFNFPTR